MQLDLERNDLSPEYLSNFLSDAPWLWLWLSVLFYCKVTQIFISLELYPDHYLLLCRWQHNHLYEVTPALVSGRLSVPVEGELWCRSVATAGSPLAGTAVVGSVASLLYLLEKWSCSSWTQMRQEYENKEPCSDTECLGAGAVTRMQLGGCVPVSEAALPALCGERS